MDQVRRPPRLAYVTNPGATSRDVVHVARAAVEGGVDVVQVRAPGLSDRLAVELARRVVEAVSPLGATVLVNERFDVAMAAGADGVHLRARGLDPREVRDAVARVEPARPLPFVVSVAAHDATDLRRAASAGADVCTIGPLGATPGKVPLGLEGLAAVLAEARVDGPLCDWLVLGGVVPDDVARLAALRAPGEGWGVAAVRAFQETEGDEETRAVAEAFRLALQAASLVPT